ncbi:unnamed protein product, partial [Symbiodinium microadriaticum]
MRRSWLLKETPPREAKAKATSTRPKAKAKARPKGRARTWAKVETPQGKKGLLPKHSTGAQQTRRARRRAPAKRAPRARRRRP